MFETLNNASEKGVDSGKKYLEFTLKYAKLKFFQKFTISASVIFKVMLTGLFIFLGITFLAISCALALAEVFNNTIYGFLATAGIFFLIALIAFFMKRTINRLILKKMSKLFFEN